MRTARTLGFLAVVAGANLSSSSAKAQLTGDQAIAVADATRSKLPPPSFGGEATFGSIGDDFFLTLALRLNFDREYWGIGVQAPLRFRIIDNDPKNDSDFIGLRKEDWDEPSDFFRILRYVYIGKRDKTGPFYIRIGELSNLTIGHGTIMHRYFNGVDPSRWRTGVNVAVNVGSFGVDAMVNDVADPYLAGLRGTVRPFQLFMGEGIWDRFVLGASLITDTRAPFELETETRDVVDPNNPGQTVPVTSVRVDSKNRPLVARERALAIVGVDMGIEVFRGDILKITPYVDLNKMNIVPNGWGFHAGVLWGLNIPVVIDDLIVDLRTEYRRVSNDYLGPYYNTIYEIERYQLLDDTGGGPLPKLTAIANAPRGGRNGLFFDLLAGLPSYVFIGGEYVDYDGDFPDGTLRLSLEVPALEIIQFSAFYYRINMDGLGDAIALDDRSSIVAQAQIPIYWVLTLNARWWRVWQADNLSAEQLAAGETESYRSVDDWSVGIGFSLAL